MLQPNDGRIALVVAGGNLPYIYNWTRNGSPFQMLVLLRI
jgi:hypothetical protein